MTFYEATKECPKVLKSLKYCLNSLSPSSVEAESRFRAVGLFISKLRSSLSDETTDFLLFTQPLCAQMILLCGCVINKVIEIWYIDSK